MVDNHDPRALGGVEERFARVFGTYVAKAYPPKDGSAGAGYPALRDRARGLLGSRLDVEFIPTDSFARARTQAWGSSGVSKRLGVETTGLFGFTGANGVTVPDTVQASTFMHETIHSWSHPEYYVWLYGRDFSDPIGNGFDEAAVDALTYEAGYRHSFLSSYSAARVFLSNQLSIGLDLLGPAVFQGDVAALQAALIQRTGVSSIAQVFAGFNALMNGQSFAAGANPR